MALHIENARPENRSDVLVLLRQGQLLTDDLPPDLSDFVVAKEADACIGLAGLERFGSTALLRSVAVAPHFQGRQIAAQLLGRLLEKATAEGLKELYLITTTADRYFERHGFRPIDRLEVPAVIRQTRQFNDLCPASAVVMKRMIN